jgi:formiminotetrahydrofolate cyclodeaminase
MNPDSVRLRPMPQWLSSLSSEAVAPGSGAAVCLAMALAAACAAKSLAVTAKHAPLTESLQARRARLERLGQRSLAAADADAVAFAGFLHHKDPDHSRALLEASRAMREIARELDEQLQGLEAVVHPIAATDLVAARELLATVSRIQARLAQENDRATASLE